VELLKRLCEADGISGREDAVVAIMTDELREVADEIRTDAMKNFIALRRGTGDGPRPVVMLAGHIDEIGFLVYNIDDKGFASLAPIGGWTPANIMGHTVRVHARKGGVLTGVVNRRPALLPEQEKKAVRMDELYIDFGLPAERVNGSVERGDWVSMDTAFREMGDCFVAKAFDDRVGAYVITEAFRKYRNPAIDVYCVGTSQEEVGIRGATVASQAIRPDIGVACDITGAGDTPGNPAHLRICQLGDGVAIKQKDGSVISSTGLVDFMRSLAEEKGIDHQMEVLLQGGTDTSAMQKFSAGAHTICLSIPTRYGHSPVAVIHRHDVETAIELLTAFLEHAHEFS
jgi:putative aminopeptidase FrvX